jgi:hypothetical protein
VLPEGLELIPAPNIEKSRSGFGSPQIGQFKFAFDAPVD